MENYEFYAFRLFKGYIFLTIFLTTQYPFNFEG